ncbi:MAG: DNA repair protein RadC [Pseudomonadota bacterium]
MSDKDQDDLPHYAGHRARLRARFLQTNGHGMPDYEWLELLLFQAIPRRDVKPLAKDLLRHFGSLPRVLRAPQTDLKTFGMSEAAIIALKSVCGIAEHLMRLETMQTQVLGNWRQLIDYLHATMAHEKQEIFRILYLSKKNELIADEVQGRGTVDHTPAYPREILKLALELGATALIMVHNHPSGDATPSQADIDLTHAVMQAARPLRITVHDHVIISAKGHSSMRNLGLIA